MAYEYESAVAFSTSTAGVEEFTRDLLERLKTVRQGINKPITFICHAAKHWRTHCRLANISSSKSHVLFAKAMTLCDTSTSTFRAWFQLY